MSTPSPALTPAERELLAALVQIATAPRCARADPEQAERAAEQAEQAGGEAIRDR